MSASLAGALKAHIEALGLGLTAFRDDAGKTDGLTRWVTITEAVSTTTEDLGDDGAENQVSELLQVDLWQPWRATAAGGAAEDYDLADQLCRGIHRAPLTGAPTTVRSCKVVSAPRLLERDTNLVHHPITVRIRRDR